MREGGRGKACPRRLPTQPSTAWDSNPLQLTKQSSLGWSNIYVLHPLNLFGIALQLSPKPARSIPPFLRGFASCTSSSHLDLEWGPCHT